MSQVSTCEHRNSSMFQVSIFNNDRELVGELFTETSKITILYLCYYAYRIAEAKVETVSSDA